jgi:hypothetical protein
MTDKVINMKKVPEQKTSRITADITSEELVDWVNSVLMLLLDQKKLDPIRALVTKQEATRHLQERFCIKLDGPVQFTPNKEDKI